MSPTRFEVPEKGKSVKRVVFVADERMFPSSFCSPVQLAFDNAVARGVLVRNTGGDNDTKHYEYLGDMTSYGRHENSKPQWSLYHVFRHNVTRETMKIRAPDGTPMVRLPELAMIEDRESA